MNEAATQSTHANKGDRAAPNADQVSGMFCTQTDGQYDEGSECD